MVDIELLKSWIGRQETASDTISSFRAAALSATLDRDDAHRDGEPLPPLWHWIYCHELPKTSELADNGHTKLGAFMPPVPLPRRMYAGGRITIQRPLLMGETAKRISTIADLTMKRGASGELVFLVIRHEFIGTDGPATVKEQDLFSREASRQHVPVEPRRPAGRPVWRRTVATNEALLFRYSALIFNAHRIHYDLPYCEREGYPGLVVHGPLIATMLADLVTRNAEAAMTAFRFRAIKPLFHPMAWAVCGIPTGDAVELWAEDA